MSQYPTAVDDASTLYVPVDRLGAATLSTTTTALAGSGDTTIAVASTDVGFPSANNLIVIGSELISYTGKTATTFTGCTRGVGNTVASAHAAGSVVIAPMSAEYILALQSAVIALQNTVGVEGAYLFQLAAEAVYAASQISFTPAGIIAATNVQAAIEEVANESARTSHTHAAGDIASGTFADARVAQSNVTQHQAALSVATSQLTGTLPDARVAQSNVTQHQAALSVATSQLTGTLPDARVAQSNVTQHQAALAIAQSQVTGLTAALAGKSAVGHVHDGADITTGTLADARVGSSSVTQHQAALSIATSQLTGTLADARVAASNVTQHQAALAIAQSQVTGLTAALAGKSATGHTHAASDIASGTLADARVAQSNVTQHQAALSIAASQLTGTLADARVAQSNVTQHESALTIAQSQVTGLTAALAGKSAVGHVHDGADITTGKIPLDRVSEVLALSDLSDVAGSTGTGNVVRTNAPTLVTPVISSFASATHNHQDAAGGGTLDGSAIASGTVSRDRLQTMVGAVASPATDGTKGAVPAPTSAEVQYFLAGDGLWHSALHRLTLVGPDLMSVTGSPATDYLSTIGLQWNAQVKNKVIASPASGADGIPTCRALVSDDIPNLDGDKIASGTVANARLVNAGVLTVTVGDGMLGGGDVALGGSVSVNAKVRSVFGRTGFVAQEAGDYTTAQIANTSVIAGSTLNEAIANLDYLKAGTSVTSDLQSQIDLISSNITSITNGLNAVGSDVQTLIAQVAALENGYAALANSVDILEGNVSDINAELTDIWNTLASKASVDHTH